jgi:hypothetical protein
VAHTLIVIAYHLQKNKTNYADLGGTYFNRIHSEGLKYLVKRLQQLGHKVTLELMEAGSRFGTLTTPSGKAVRIFSNESATAILTFYCGMNALGLVQRFPEH